MIKQILLIHPLGQTAALFFGFFNIFTGFTRKLFNLPIHINCGVLFYAMTFIGTGLGVFVTEWAEKQGTVMPLELHGINAMLLLLIMAVGASTGFALLANKKKRNGIIRYHRFANLAAVILYIVQAITGTMGLLPVL